MSTKKDQETSQGSFAIEQDSTPSLYKVILHNDDYTTMEFVIEVLQKVFSKPLEEAEAIMWTIHKTGIGVCGVYTFEIAETKVMKVIQMAKEASHPLKCTMVSE